MSYYEAGLERRQAGQLLDAARELQKAIDADPDFLDAHFELAKLHRKMGMFEESADRLDRCVAELTGDAEVLREAAEVRLLSGSIDGALSLYENLQDLDPLDEDVASTWVAIALVHEGTKKAVKKVRKCLEDHPGWVGGFLYLGNLGEMEGRLTEAEEAYQRLLDLSPDHRGALDNLDRLRNGAPLELSPLSLAYDAIFFAECRRLLSDGFPERAREWMTRWKERHPHRPMYAEMLSDLVREAGRTPNVAANE